VRTIRDRSFIVALIRNRSFMVMPIRDRSFTSTLLETQSVAQIPCLSVFLLCPGSLGFQLKPRRQLIRRVASYM
jgi:hypothetical protein